MALTYSLSKLVDDIHKKIEKPYMTIPLRSMINTPSTPLCEEIRAIVSSISAAVDDSTAASLEELISLQSVLWSGLVRSGQWRSAHHGCCSRAPRVTLSSRSHIVAVGLRTWCVNND